MKQRIYILIIAFLLFFILANFTQSSQIKLIPAIPLRNPTYDEVEWFLEHDQTNTHPHSDSYDCLNFTRDTVLNASRYGLLCYHTVVCNQDSSIDHAIISFETTDYGQQYFEPQTDENVNPKDIALPKNETLLSIKTLAIILIFSLIPLIWDLYGGP